MLNKKPFDSKGEQEDKAYLAEAVAKALYP